MIGSFVTQWPHIISFKYYLSDFVTTKKEEESPAQEKDASPLLFKPHPLTTLTGCMITFGQNVNHVFHFIMI